VISGTEVEIMKATRFAPGNKGWLLGLGLGAGILWLASFSLFAQQQFGSIAGLVSDPSGAVIPGATVTVTNEHTQVANTVQSNGEGYYTVTSLIPGTYNVSVSKAGFSSVTRVGVNLDVAQNARIDVALAVGQISQQIEVTAAGTLLQTESAMVGNVMPTASVDQLPLNGRNYLELATLAPGAIADTVTGFGIGGNFFGAPMSSIEVNGMRDSDTDYYIDGANVYEQLTIGTPFTPAPDAIEEFKVLTNDMSARYGNGGAIINTVLKSGTESFHGNAYEFLRNDALDSRNFFASTTPKLERNQFGATFGGPIVKGRTFFFADYQGTRLINGETYDSTVPTAQEEEGIFPTPITNPYTGQAFPGNQINIPFSPQATFLMQQFIPLPNASGDSYLSSGDDVLPSNQGDLRIDQQLNRSQRLAFTYGIVDGNFKYASAFPNNGRTNGPYRSQFTNLEWIWNVTPSIFNSAHMAYERTTAYETGQGIGTNYTEQAGIQGFELTSLAYPGPPGVSIAGLVNAGPVSWGGTPITGYPFLPLGQTYGQFNEGDVLTWIKGKHTVELGGDARNYDGYNYNGAWSRGSFDFTGQYTGNGIADFLLGLPYDGRRGFPRNWFGILERDQDVFIEDSWRATPRLTLIGGLRWDVDHPPTSMNNAYASISPYTDQIIVATGRNGMINTNTQQITALLLPIYASRIIPSSEVGLPPSLVQMDNHAFAPRLGLAYRTTHDFVLRAGYGIFYPLTNANQIISSGIVNPPFIQDELTRFNSTPVPTTNFSNFFPVLTPSTIASGLGPATFFMLDPWRTDAYLQQWNFSVQKLVAGVLSVQAAYIGSKGTHLTFSAPENIPPPGPGDIQSRRLDPFFSAGSLIDSAGLSNYDSLQLTAETRNWHGVYLLGAYTWAKSLDNISAGDQGSPVQDPANIRAEWGISDFNVASRLTLSSTWNMPFLRNRHDLLGSIVGGWAMSNIITLQGGFPFTPGIETDPANTGTPMRADRSGSGKLSNPTVGEWFDYTAFGPPTCYCYGNSARNVLTGPPLNNWDFSLFKDFDMHRFREGMRMQFRGEFFDFTNTPHFGQPDTDVMAGPGTSGAIFSAGAPRQIQLALKFYF
jgi:outer membrane receptor protein involved in Fe transport